MPNDSVQGFQILSPEEYFSRFWKSHDRVQEQANALIKAQLVEDSPSKRRGRSRQLYPNYLSPSAAQAGLDRGTLIKVHLASNRQ